MPGLPQGVLGERDMSEVELPATPVAISAEALFRYRIVAHVLARVACGVARADAIREVADEEEEHVELGSGRVRVVSVRTVYRWLAAHAKCGVAGLEPCPSSRETTLAPRLLDFLRSEKTSDALASVPELLRRAVVRGIVEEGDLHRTTAYRALRRMDLPTSATTSKREADMRRFAYPHRMRMVLVDGKHFRAGQSRLRRVAFFFIDDCTRLVLGAVVGGPGEKTKVFLRGLFDIICRYGLMDILYFDGGPAFFSRDTHAVCVRLELRFIHGRRRYPEGRAKVERFNRTASADCLRGLRAPDVDPDNGPLELRIGHYLDTQYNVRAHEGIGNLTPRAKWDGDERALRFPASVDALRERFFVSETRKVSADNIIKVGSANYEVARGYANSRIEIRRHTLDGRVCILHKGRIVDLHPVDLARNAESPRSSVIKDDAARAGDEGEAPTTAAALAFARDFGPVLDIPSHKDK
jgi:transposase InsO family protein